ncbi:MAG: hypothetical protein MIN69_14170 [Methylorubrum extorquens]|jgi:hypothetical protein|uniref:hypothetical protein n=1 Tax=Methylorubrum extorquens TaxID=408 RepID=UPI002FEE3BBD
MWVTLERHRPVKEQAMAGRHNINARGIGDWTACLDVSRLKLSIRHAIVARAGRLVPLEFKCERKCDFCFGSR